MCAHLTFLQLLHPDDYCFPKFAGKRGQASAASVGGGFIARVNEALGAMTRDLPAYDT